MSNSGWIFLLLVIGLPLAMMFMHRGGHAHGGTGGGCGGGGHGGHNPGSDHSDDTESAPATAGRNLSSRLRRSSRFISE